MNTKEHLDRANHAVEKTAKNLRDSVDGSLHESAADAQRARREAEGDEMSTKEKIVSHVDEIEHRVAASVDEAKKKARG